MSDNQSQRYRKGMFFCVLLFVSLCLFHYFSLRPLWLDERYVFESIETYHYSEIFGPLKTEQAFPRIYLVLVKAVASLFDYHLFSLRFFSLIFMLCAFIIWKKLYENHFQKKDLLLLALLSFCSSYRLTYYAAELKHYSMDVLAVAVFAYFFHYQSKVVNEKPTLTLLAMSAFLPVLIFFSYGGLLVFWIVPLNYFFIMRANSKYTRLFWLSLFSSLICFMTYYFIDLRFSMSLKGIHSYWQSYFLCTDSFTCFADTFGDGMKKLITYWFGTEKIHMRMAVIFIPFFLYSLGRYGFLTWEKEGFKIFRLDALGLVLMMELFILGLLKIYPFTGERITLFFAPFAFYFILKGIDSLKNIKPLRQLFLGYYGIFIVICLFNTISIHVKLYL